MYREALLSYVPRIVAEMLTDELPLRRRFPAAVMFADISGFTPLTERLDVEELSRLLDDYFGRLIALIAAQDGQIIKIAGDAFLVIWEDPDGQARAETCARSILRDLDGHQGLSLRIALTHGDVELQVVGGLRDRAEFFVSGPPLAALQPLLEGAQPGQLVGNVGHPPVGPAPVREPPSEVSVAALERLIPGAVLTRLRAGHLGWLSELRRITVVFVNLRNHDFARSHEVFLAVQAALYEHQGSVNQFLCDDKGTSLLAAFGLPPMSHVDDPVRACRAALSIAARLEATVGVATGLAFCGTRGSPLRREYCMLGDVVNFAARLMVKAAPVLCDQATWEAARERLHFREEAPLRLKGKEQEVRVFVPEAERASQQVTMIGRSAELQALLTFLETEGGLFVVEGEPGSGKSTLAAVLAERAGWPVVWGACDEDAQNVAWYPWRAVLRELVRPEEVSAAERPLLDLDLPDTELTAGLDGEGRAQRTIELITRLLAGKKVLILLEDTHWADSLSLRLAQALPGPIGLFTRTAPPFEAFTVRLGPMPARELEELARHSAGELSPEALRWLQEKSQGNPFFCQELARGLRDATLETLPDTLNGLIVNRVDRLSPSHQLTVKVASVIGRHFGVRLLDRVHPIEQEREQLPAILEELEGTDWLSLLAPESYQFRHALMHEAIYKLLLQSQRQELHRRVARELEESGEGLSVQRAQHWERAGETGKAARYYREAGREALDEGAYEEAAESLRRALLLAPDDAHTERLLGEALYGMSELPESRAHLERTLELLGERVPRTEGQLRRNPYHLVAQAGRAFLHSGPLAPLFVDRMLSVVARWWQPAEPAEGETRARALDGARAAEALTMVCYYLDDLRRTYVYGTLQQRYAERAGPCPELARAYGNLCGGLALMGLHRLAAAYGERARGLAESLGDPFTTGRVAHLDAFNEYAQGHWELALAGFQQAREIMEGIRNRRWWAESTFMLANVAYSAGRWELARELAAELTGKDPQEVLWRAGIQGILECHAGRVREALELAELPRTKVNDPTEICLQAVRLRAGEPGALEAILRQAGDGRGYFGFLFTPLDWACQHLVESGDERRARSLWGHMQRNARIFPITRAQVAYHRVRIACMKSGKRL